MTHLRQDQIWDDDAAAGYDTPGTGMFAPEVLGPTVDRLAALAEGGRALELAIGTGRVAVPLAERGVPVTGIELSAPMVARLREKADEATIPVVMGDMATAQRRGQLPARLPGLQHDLEPAHPRRAGRLLRERRPASRARRPVRRRAVGARAAPAAARRAGDRRRPRGRLHPRSTPTTSCTSTSSPTTSPSRSPAGGRLASGAVRTATSGRASWT